MNWPLVKVISGGQRGADQAGLRAAVARGYATGGMAPRNYRTEDGCDYTLRDTYGLIASHFSDPAKRTRWNILHSDGTIIFGDVGEPGSGLTLRIAIEVGKPSLVIANETVAWASREEWIRWILRNGITVLNVAGNRESKRPGIGKWVEGWLGEVLPRVEEGSV